MRFYYLTISTYIGISCGAMHYYGRIRYDSNDGDHKEVDLEHPISPRASRKINRSEGWIVFRPGDMIRSFASENEVRDAAIKWFIEAGDSQGILLEGLFASADPMKALAGDPAAIENINSLYAAWESIHGWGGVHSAAQTVADLWDSLMRELSLS